MTTRRLPQRPGEIIDRGRRIEFTWNGSVAFGLEGDTIASALAAAGVSVFSRSFKYHRPRGILTADHHDPNLFLQVDDEPNVRGGHRLVEDAMAVRSQNAWPSLRYDLRSANRLVGRFLTPGFYYKTFMAPEPLKPTYQRVLRRFSAGGTVGTATQRTFSEKHFAHPDVVVAGGGPAGMAAAVAAADAGARVMLVEENRTLGGHLRYAGAAALGPLSDLRDAVRAADGIEVLTDAAVTGRYDHNWVGIVQATAAAERLIKARAKCLVVAAGKIERPYVFEGNDLPGVMLSGAAMRLMNLWAVSPGARAVVVTANDRGDAVVEQLGGAGVDVAEVVDLRQTKQQLVRARGRGRLASVEVSDGRVIDADLLVIAVGWTTATSLLNMAGARPVYEPRTARFLSGDLPDDVMATGEIVGDGSLDELIAHGSAVGAEAGRRALRRAFDWAKSTPRAQPATPPSDEPTTIPPLAAADHPELFSAPSDGFVDFSEDVRGKDLALAAAEGYHSIELSKRYTTATMGPIQGKLELVNAVAVHAEAIGATIAETGTTTWRPPYAPITLGALAGADEDPVRRSPMHDWHVEHRAVPLVAGQWIRPDHYGDPAAEVGNTREHVGIIDVSPLGKIDLRGPDVSKLLDFVYINRWSQLGIGRVRYGAMVGEDGVVIDDGVTARLGEDRYYMTTTSSGAGRVWHWLDDWMQTTAPWWDVRMTAVSDGYAAMNVAGPNSRRLLERVAEDIDLSADAFAYMQARTGTVAGIPDCIVLRIGFTGELSFELHVPAGFGLHVWTSLLEAGADLGVEPFGIEAQRIMRLEKGHLIVGQDTDGLTKAHEAALGWAVRADKADCAGKPELQWESEAGPRRMLVAIQPDAPSLVPAEASQIVAGDRIVGRVTSSRMSPTLGRGVCLAMIDADFAEPGATVTIRLPDGTNAAATVMEQTAHFDPEGERLRG